MIDKFRCLPWFQQASLEAQIDLPQEKIPLAVVYTMWGHDKYLDLLRLSLYSQYRYTDAARASVVIFTTYSLVQKLVDAVKGYPVDIVPLPDPIRKYSVLTNAHLDRFEQIVVCDCDTFFHSNGPDPQMAWHANLYERLSKNQKLLMLQDTDPGLKVLYDRKCLSNMWEASNEKYADWIKSLGYGDVIDRIAALPSWYLSCFTSFPRQTFQGDDWQSLCDQFLKVNHGCDETAFIMFAIKKGYSIADIKSFVEARTVYGAKIGDFLNYPELDAHVLSIIHPLHGDYCHDARVLDFFRSITEPQNKP